MHDKPLFTPFLFYATHFLAIALVSTSALALYTIADLLLSR